MASAATSHITQGSSILGLTQTQWLVKGRIGQDNSKGLARSRATRSVLGSIWGLAPSLCLLSSPPTGFLELLPESPTCNRYKEEMGFNEGPLSNGHPAEHFPYTALAVFAAALWAGRTLDPLTKEETGTGQTPGQGQSEDGGSRETPRGLEV